MRARRRRRGRKGDGGEGSSTPSRRKVVAASEEVVAFERQNRRCVGSEFTLRSSPARRRTNHVCSPTPSVRLSRPPVFQNACPATPVHHPCGCARIVPPPQNNVGNAASAPCHSSLSPSPVLLRELVREGRPALRVHTITSTMKPTTQTRVKKPPPSCLKCLLPVGRRCPRIRTERNATPQTMLEKVVVFYAIGIFKPRVVCPEATTA